MRRIFSQKRRVESQDMVASTSTREPVSILDSTKQLEMIYEQLSKDEGGDEEWKKEFFQSLRILVLGRSGSGKTTLIRLIVGEGGPEEVAEGKPGEQDINKEYYYYGSANSICLIIHDSNGVDAKGKERADAIKAFFEKHEKSDDFSQHVHLVWYVVSSIDSRCLDDADIMKIVSETGIPLLLIMTFNDYVKDRSPEDRIVTDDIVDKLLEGVKDKQTIKKNMVRVGNGGVKMKKKELEIDSSKVDTKALKIVSQRTQNLMAKKLRYSWAAFQAVDMDAKLDASAGLIIFYSRSALLTSLPRVILLGDALRLAIIFLRVFICLCEIWRVPKPLKNALKKTIVNKEGSSHILRSICQDILFVGSLAVSVGATVATYGLALPSVIGVLAASGFLNVRSVPILVKTFALQVLATILYVKCTQPRALTKNKWDANVEEKDYIEHCEDFSHNHAYDKSLRDFATAQHSTLSTLMGHKKVRGLIKSKIVDLFEDIHLKRPASLYSHFITSSSSSSSSDQNIVPNALDYLDLQQESNAQEENDSSGYDFENGDVIEDFDRSY